MENIKRACALGGVSVQAAPIEPRTTQSVPFMQMAEKTDSNILARKDDHIEVTALKFNGMLDSIEKFIDRLTKSVARTAEIQDRKLDRDNKDRHRRSSTDSRDNRDSRNSRDSRRSYRSDSDSSSEDDRQKSRSRDSSRSRSRSRGIASITCAYCHKPNHDVSHCYKIVRCNLAMHHLVTPFVIWQPIRRPCLLERVYKPMHTPH